VHVPAVQISPEAHARPHMPQFKRSPARSRQTPVQFIRPAPHETVHIPREQT
jgi:hypothetical protein